MLTCTMVRSMCNLYNEIAPEVSYGEANYEICSIEFYFTLFGMVLYGIFKHNILGINSKLIVLDFRD